VLGAATDTADSYALLLFCYAVQGAGEKLGDIPNVSNCSNLNTTAFSIYIYISCATGYRYCGVEFRLLFV
jgi:hypothetical protein